MHAWDRDLTAGVIDPSAERIFLHGGCGALAVALHAETGWPIVAITDHDNVDGGRAGGGSALHYVVRHPSGDLLDIEGLHAADDLLDDYHGEADDGQAALGVASRADVLDWWLEAGAKVSLEMAATFVAPLLDLIAPRGSSAPL